MLTADLIRCRVSREGVLTLVGGAAKQRPRQVGLAQAMIDVVDNHLDCARDVVVKGLEQIPFAPNERKLMLGLRKILLDECVFEQSMTLEPELVREQVWILAAQQWRVLSPEAVFDRVAVLQTVAKDFDVSVEVLEGALFADLKSAHCLKSWSKVDADRLVGLYHSAQAQSVFLKAVKVTLEFKPTSAVELRRFFHLLKFRGLLFRVVARSKDGICLSIDGPVSLFNQTSRYGLKLATLIPRLTQFGSGVAKAELSWGSHRKRIMYEHTFKLQKRKGKAAKVPLNEILEKLIAGWKDDSGWTIKVVTGHLIQTAGQALVPDIECIHGSSGKSVYLELMGFWSRDAVWQRVELVKHLKTPFVFLVSERLRVSEKVLEPSDNGALFVFKGVINRKRLLEQLNQFL
jgi:uncharacterized protein